MVKNSDWSENLVLFHTSKGTFLNFLKYEVFYILLLDLTSTYFLHFLVNVLYLPQAINDELCFKIILYSAILKFLE